MSCNDQISHGFHYILVLASGSSTSIWLMFIVLQAFQVLSEYLQLLDCFSELSAVQEMSRSVEASIFHNPIQIFSPSLL